MSDNTLEFPDAPLSPSLPSDFLDPLNSGPDTNGHSETPPAKPRKPASAAKPKAPTLSAEDERKSKELNREMTAWVDRARTKKHDSDRARSDRKHRLACILALDAVVCFMIGFDYEDRSDQLKLPSSNGSTTGTASSATNSGQSAPSKSTPTHARSWSTLIPYLAKLASSAESVDADLAGVYYQVCAVVRLNVIYVQRRSLPAEESARNLYAALADFRRGLALLPLHIIQNHYGLNEENGWLATRINAKKPDPQENRGALPLHVNSTLAEAAAFALNIGKKWAKMEGIDYTWDAGRL